MTTIRMIRVCARLTCVRVQVSLEPVLHQVSEAVAETLRPHTAAADFVSPDWDTALALSRLQAHDSQMIQ
jgi:hypothetical protein